MTILEKFIALVTDAPQADKATSLFDPPANRTFEELVESNHLLTWGETDIDADTMLRYAAEYPHHAIGPAKLIEDPRRFPTCFAA